MTDQQSSAPCEPGLARTVPLARRLLPLALAGGLALGALGACSSETRESVGDAAESAGEDIENATGEVSARVVADTYATALQTDGTADTEGVRSITVLQENVEDLPGEPEITGIDDGDGDGLDDDGLVQVTVGDAGACVTLPETGDDVEVTSGAC